MVKNMGSLAFAFGILLVNLTIQTSAANYSLNLVGQGPGTVSRNPTNSSYPQGVVVTITATPNAGAYFAGWSGDVNSSANPLNVNITGNLSITGSFLPFPTYTVSLLTNGQGTIALNPSAPTYYSNTIVTATATPAAGWVFAGWSGNLAGIVNPLAITVDTNVSLTGSFGQIPIFDLEPQGVTNSSGSTVSISSQVTGTGPLSYQWYFAGSSDEGATNANLTIANAGTASSGQYWLVASSPYGSVTSSIISLLITNSSSSTNIISVCDEAGLRAAIAIGGWITIGCNGTITLSSPIDITNDIILDGANVSATISGGGLTRLFNIATNASLSITNIILADGNVSIASSATVTNADGGAIYNQGTLSLTSCILSNDIALAMVASGVARGGAIFNLDGAVFLSNSIFENNYIDSGTNFGDVTSPSFAGGTSLGGALYNDGGAMILSHVFLLNNSLSALGFYQTSPSLCGGIGLGGAIFNTNGSLVLLDSVISNNFCTAQPGPNSECLGGGIFHASGLLAITNSLIFTNSVVGGGVLAGVIYSPQPAYGGGIAALMGDVSLDHVDCVGNIAQSGATGYHTSSSPAFGGGIYNQANLNAVYCAFNGNVALVGSGSRTYESSASGSGGAIYNLGALILDRSCVFFNRVQGSYGISYQFVPGNGGSSSGAGIFNVGQFLATNTTIAFNTCLSGTGTAAYGNPPYSFYPAGTNGNALGGGVYNGSGGVFNAWNVTIATNVAIASSNATYNIEGYPGQALGAQVYNNGTQLSLHNSILAYSGSNSNASGTITDSGYNISSDGSANFESGSSYNFTDPLLGPLASNGGPTLTMALLPNSPAIDSGTSNDAPVTDQRGYFRLAGNGIDIGAFGYDAVAPTQNGWLSFFRVNGTYSFNFTVATNVSYVLQTSTDLKTWSLLENLGSFSIPAVITFNLPAEFSTTTNRYFRMLMK